MDNTISGEIKRSAGAKGVGAGGVRAGGIITLSHTSTPHYHNPDSNCVQCCAQNEEIYSRLIPLIAKAEAVVASLDKEKIEAVVEKMDEAMDHPILKMLLKTLKKMRE